ELKEETIKELQEQFNELNGQTNQVEGDEPSLSQVAQAKKKNRSAMKSFFSSIQQQRNESSNQSEFDKYLFIPQIDQTEENNPLTWWKQRKSDFLMLCLFAKKYLSIPASSIPSERLFLDAGNH
ncbi:12172_t:CDS:1, partial [Racocetra fulgida]